MRKRMLLSLPLALLLGACVSSRDYLPPIAKTSDAARAAVPFCDVARRSWGDAVDGDPGRTLAQKAAYNAARAKLKCGG